MTDVQILRIVKEMEDSVVSTRIRLARNVVGMPFPKKMTGEQAQILTNAVKRALGRNYDFISVKDTDENILGSLVERHLISKELMTSRFGSVLISNDDTVSIMLCEEDHIREQVIIQGFALDSAFEIADSVDEQIGLGVDFAYSENLGHLTACPTNLGTGMRASVMLFLPALTLTKTFDSAVKSLSGYHITVRGVYGEGSEAHGYFYQISNARTLGQSEYEIIETVKLATAKLLNAEKQAREILYDKKEIKLKNDIFRAYGILRSAFTLGVDEYLRYTAFVKLGVYYGLINGISVPTLDELTSSMQPYSLISVGELPPETDEAIDIERAKQVREFFGSLID
ncbi:MAG: ATP--guanido phosphotransferase [Clostridia bacterium]|nr:ATP--guanido phosphotransferase [Clostridia bacterium]